MAGRAIDCNAQTGPLLDAALAYGCRGWSVIPTNGKRAACRWRLYQQAAPDENALRRLFGRASVTGLAVVLGAASAGLAVRDFDSESAYHEWASANPDAAAQLPTVLTPRGRHVYGRLDHETYADLGDGELRADAGHYVLLPPSRHPSGSFYTWLNPLPKGDLPALPDSLLGASGTAVSGGETQHSHADSADPSIPSINIAWWTSAVASTLPTKPGQRNRRVFDLARLLKGMKPDAEPRELREIVRERCVHALPRTSGEHGFDDCWTDFTVAWQRVIRPAGQSFAVAAVAADSKELPAFLEHFGYDGPLRRLLALCWQLAQQWGDKPFPLGCEIAGRYLGVSTRHAGRLLQALRFDGVITRISKGTKESGKASEWRFNVNV